VIRRHASGPAQVLAASDLDRTLIYSRAAVGAAVAQSDLVCVEEYQGRPASFVTATAARLLTELAAVGVLVPVTTRTVAQLARVGLPGRQPRFAVAANGGTILCDGQPDPDWARAVARRLADSAPLAEVMGTVTATCLPEWTSAVRSADDLFCYAVLDRAAMPLDFLAETTQWADSVGWQTSLQGRKLYWVPNGLTKSAAITEVALRCGAERVVAAGDSLLDTDLLQAADAAIMPRHGELFETGWTAPQVRLTQSSGILAGEQIAAWLLAQMAESRPFGPEPAGSQ
jgi:hypothetical protein